jgi:hypothetical protein
MAITARMARFNQYSSSMFAGTLKLATERDLIRFRKHAINTGKMLPADDRLT